MDAGFRGRGYFSLRSHQENAKSLPPSAPLIASQRVSHLFKELYEYSVRSFAYMRILTGQSMRWAHSLFCLQGFEYGCGD